MLKLINKVVFIEKSKNVDVGNEGKRNIDQRDKKKKTTEHPSRRISHPHLHDPMPFPLSKDVNARFCSGSL